MGISISANIKLSEVINYLNDLGTYTKLSECLTNAVDAKFDPTYKGSKDRLSNFRGYDLPPDSYSGQYVCAVGWDGNIYTSDDYGGTWTNRGYSREWYDCWVSLDGKYMYACANDDFIFYSTDYGVTWSVIFNNKAWYALAGNQSDSTHWNIYASENGSGNIWKSINGGTWTAVGSTAKDWYGLAVSADDKYLTAVSNGGYIWTWSGSTWVQRGVSKDWRDVAMSSDGQYQTAVNWAGNVYVSTNYGSTWTYKMDSVGNLNSVDMTSNGQYQWTVGNPAIYISTNYGSTWSRLGLWSDEDYKSVTVASTYANLWWFTAIKNDDILNKFQFTALNVHQDWKGIACNKQDSSTPTTGTTSIGTVAADSIQVNWTAGASINNVSGYLLYWKIAGGSYAEIDVGKVLTYTKTGLSAGQYYFYVKAKDAFGNVSNASNIVNYTIPSGVVLEVSPGILSFNYFVNCAGNTITVNASLGNSWVATSNAAWCIVTDGSGTGSGSFTVSCTKAVAFRDTTISVVSSAPTKTVSIIQDSSCP